MRKKVVNFDSANPAKRLRGKKPYSSPQLTRLTPDEAKAKLTAGAVPSDANAKRLWERIAQLEQRQHEKN